MPLIQQTEMLKAVAQKAIKWFHRISGHSRDDIHADLSTCPDPVARRLFGHVDAVIAQVRSPYHRDSARDVAEFAQFVVMADSAYRPLRDALLRRLAEDAEWLLANVPDKDPKAWHANVQHEYNHEGGGARP